MQSYFFILIILIELSVWFIRGIRESLYKYSNLMYLTGILFFSTFLIDGIVSLIRCKINNIAFDKIHIVEAFLDFPRKFTYIALFVFGILAVLLFISNISLIKHEGFRTKNLLGIFLSIIYIGGTNVVYFLGDHLDLKRDLLVFFLLMICYMECFLLSTIIVGYLAAIQKPKYDKDYIIIPGCAISKKGGLRPLLKGRANRAINYAWEQEINTGRPVKYIPSGGQGPDEVISEASAIELYLLSHGAESYEIFPEKNSFNTYENFRNSKEIINSIDKNANIAFATTNYHMLRCGLIAYSLGINAEGISSDTKWYFWPNGFIREYIAILFMKKKVHITIMVLCAILCLITALCIA